MAEGCQQIDVVIAVDGTNSMIEEIQTLASSAGARSIVDALAGINCGSVDFRIGITNDNDGGWFGISGSDWFDSTMMTEDEIVDALGDALEDVPDANSTDGGCEHVLNSAGDLLENDSTGFVRDGALLLVVLVTDVDDYGAYDQMGFGGPCDSSLCTVSGLTPGQVRTNLVALKGAAEAVSAIVVAGDPLAHEGDNFCGQPASCCGGGADCDQAFQAPNVYEFAGLLDDRGITVDLCDGEDTIAEAIGAAISADIEPVCQAYVQ